MLYENSYSTCRKYQVMQSSVNRIHKSALAHSCDSEMSKTSQLQRFVNAQKASFDWHSKARKNWLAIKEAHY